MRSHSRLLVLSIWMMGVTVNQVRKLMNINTKANQSMHAVQVLDVYTVTDLREQYNRRYQSKTCCAIVVLCRLSMVGIRPIEGMHCTANGSSRVLSPGSRTLCAPAVNSLFNAPPTMYHELTGRVGPLTDKTVCTCMCVISTTMHYTTMSEL